MRSFKTYGLIAALSMTATLSAQTEVTSGVSHGKDYGVTYLLPKTQIDIVVKATKTIYTPGEFVRYADRYLHQKDAAAEASTTYTLTSIETQLVGIPDKDEVYFVKLKDKTIAPLMELTEDGVVRSINMPFSGTKAKAKDVNALDNKKVETQDPRRFLTEEILRAGSTAKMAELTAKEIYAIRESRNALLRGEADNMPQDGEQLKLMLQNLQEQENGMLSLFLGTKTVETKEKVISITPHEMNNEIVFRFSKMLGIVDKDDLSGEPYYLSITDLKTPNITTDAEVKKKVEGICYNVPGRANVTLTCRGKKIYEKELPITQFGCQEYLAPALFNKTQCKVQFDINTGGLIKIDRE